MKLRYDPMINYVASKIDQNKNFIIIINGPTGSGKTYAALRFAEDIAKKMGTKFSVEKNTAFKFDELLKKMKLPENKKAGTPFVFEEVGAVGGGAAATEWQTKANAFFGTFLQTSRSKNRILIMTCPSFSDLDAKGRRLCHSQWEMSSINFTSKFSRAKPFVLQVNRRSGQIYHKYLPFTSEGLSYRFRTIVFKLPSKHIIKKYEVIKDEFVEALEKIIIERNKPKEVKKKEHSHSWMFRLTKGDKWCRTCGKIEKIPKENEFVGCATTKRTSFNSTCSPLGGEQPIKTGGV